MLKKYEKIIKGVLNPTYEQTEKGQFNVDTGFYYVTDGFRCVRFAENINDLPLFKDGEKTYNIWRVKVKYKNGITIIKSLWLLGIIPLFIIIDKDV